MVIYLKGSFKTIGDKGFLLMPDKDNGWYISLDLQNGEDIFFSLINTNKSYDSDFLIAALIRELLRLWRNEKYQIIKGDPT